jgi:hypothetical protein
LLGVGLEMKQCPRVIHSSFGAWLRSERERRKISIASIAEKTKILGALFEGLEDDNLSRWPDGFYRRAFVRAYAEAIGLDPQMVVNEFVTRFADGQTPSNHTTSNGSIPAYEVAQETDLRLTLADPERRVRLLRRLQAIALRFAAIAVDLAVIALLSAGLWMVVDPWFALATVACGYHAAGILILGNTPGVSAFTGRTRNNDRRSSLFRRVHANVLRRIERRAETSTPVEDAMPSFDAGMEAEPIHVAN